MKHIFRMHILLVGFFMLSHSPAQRSPKTIELKKPADSSLTDIFLDLPGEQIKKQIDEHSKYYYENYRNLKRDFIIIGEIYKEYFIDTDGQKYYYGSRISSDKDGILRPGNGIEIWKLFNVVYKGKKLLTADFTNRKIDSLNVKFTDKSEGADLEWSWDFDGDGDEDAEGGGPHLHQYTVEGTYDVTLTIRNEGKGYFDTFHHSVLIHTPPVVATVEKSPLKSGNKSKTISKSNPNKVLSKDHKPSKENKISTLKGQKPYRLPTPKKEKKQEKNSYSEVIKNPQHDYDINKNRRWRIQAWSKVCPQNCDLEDLCNRSTLPNMIGSKKILEASEYQFDIFDTTYCNENKYDYIIWIRGDRDGFFKTEDSAKKYLKILKNMSFHDSMISERKF